MSMEYPKGKEQYEHKRTSGKLEPFMVLSEAKERLEATKIRKDILGSQEEVNEKVRKVWEIQAERRALRFEMNINKLKIEQNKDASLRVLRNAFQLRNIDLSKKENSLMVKEVNLKKEIGEMPDTTILLNKDSSVPVLFRASHHIPDENGILDHVRFSGKNDVARDPIGVFVGTKEEADRHAKAREDSEQVGFSLMYSVNLNIRKPLVIGHKFWHEDKLMQTYLKQKREGLDEIDSVIVVRALKNKEEAINEIMNGDFSDVLDVIVRNPKNIVPLSVELFKEKEGK